ERDLLGHGYRPGALRLEPLLAHRARQVHFLGPELQVQHAQHFAVAEDRRAQAGAGRRHDEVLADQLRTRLLDYVRLAAAQAPAVVLADDRVAGEPRVAPGGHRLEQVVAEVAQVQVAR